MLYAREHITETYFYQARDKAALDEHWQHRLETTRTRKHTKVRTIKEKKNLAGSCSLEGQMAPQSRVKKEQQKVNMHAELT
jgi:hypothetical protein